MTLFLSTVAAPGVDLRHSPFSRLKKHWMDPIDYCYMQDFARQARAKKIGAILYASVRDPEQGAAATVLSRSAFSLGQVPKFEIWYLTVNRAKVIWAHELGQSFEFSWAE